MPARLHRGFIMTFQAQISIVPLSEIDSFWRDVLTTAIVRKSVESNLAFG
jgi:hypothetical protein